MSNKLLLTFALIGIIAVFSCGLLLPMPIGFKVSMITAGVMMIVMFSIIIPFDRKHIVRKKDIKLILQKQKYIFAGMYLIRFRLAWQCMHAYVCKH
ncbi:putative membrane protein [Bacillus anthracis str. Sterne]|nr:putative membrane protein [Bacillus anthracis str. Sterne]